MKSTLPAPLRKLLKDVEVSVNGLIDDKTIDADLKTELVEIRGQLKASLEADGGSEGGDEALTVALKSAQSTIEVSQKLIESVQKKAELALASVGPEVEKQVGEKLKTGDYLAKDAAQGLIEKARKEGEDAGFSRGKLLGDRRTALAVAGIPAEVAQTAPETILLGEEKEFNTARDTAKSRVEKLTGLGLASAHSTVKSLAWAKPEDFDVQFATFSDLVKGKGKSDNTPPKNPLNPFMGGSGNTGDTKKTVIAC